MAKPDESVAGWRRALRPLLAIGLALALAAVAGEVLVRGLVGAPWPERMPILRVQANAARGWEMVPGEAHYTYDHRVAVNALGLRGPELAPRAPGEVRVLALGDSLVYGQGVGDDDTLPARLAAELVARDPAGRPWTVVNAGHRAYATHQELALLEELGERVDPDVVVLFWYWNDLEERDVARTFADLSASGPIAFDLGVPAEGAALRAWERKQLLRRSALLMVVHDLVATTQGEAWDAALVERGFEKLDGYLARFGEWAAAHDARFVFAVLPDPANVDGDSPTAGHERRATELAGRHGLPTLELLPAVRAATERLGALPVIPYDGHYLPEGNHAMAEAAAEQLLELLGG
jgi:hypothetical protein